MSELPKPSVILMAEDDADDRLLVKDALSECKCEADLRFVENGEELLEYLLHDPKTTSSGPTRRPALIILDLNMPRKDGREALREIKSNPELRAIPVVVLTTSRADTDIDGIYQLGANSFISKPVRFEELVNLMRLLAQYWLNTVALPAPR